MSLSHEVKGQGSKQVTISHEFEYQHSSIFLLEVFDKMMKLILIPKSTKV